MHPRIKAFSHAISGLNTFFKDTYHAKIHAIATIVVISCGFYFGISIQEWQVILICITLVFSAEAINSAIEYTVDLANPDYTLLAKKAKDVSAAAVLITAIFSVIIAVIIFYPKISLQWF